MKSHLRKSITASAVISALLLVLCYCYWNLPYTLGKGNTQMKRISTFKYLSSRDKIDENILPVNISHDKMLVPHYDQLGMQDGVVAITDRGKLLEFVNILKDAEYKCLLCDVSFDNGIRTELDDSLFSIFAGMDHVILPMVNENQMPEMLRSKAAVASYMMLTIKDGFAKYRYLTPEGKDHLALRMWKETAAPGEERDFRKHWWGYSRNGRLATNSIVVPLNFNMNVDFLRDGSDSDMYKKTVYNLGSDILDDDPEYVLPLFKDKIILLGDWRDRDMHVTFINYQPGIVLVYNAFLCLLEGKNRVPFWILLLLFAIFFLESLFIIMMNNPDRYDFSHNKIIRWATASPFRRYLCELVTYNTPMAVICYLIFIFEGFFVNSLIIGSLFATVSSFISYIRK